MKAQGSVAAGTERPPRAGSSREQLSARLRSLRNLEAFNVAWFWLLFALAWRGAQHPTQWTLRTYALIVVSVILLEGSYYWHLKLRSVRTKAGLPVSFGRRFSRLRLANLALLLVAPALALPAWHAGASNALDLVMGSLLLIFAALEHINYFHRQLMHDSRNDWAYLRRHRRLRRAPLAEDLERGLPPP